MKTPIDLESSYPYCLRRVSQVWYCGVEQKPIVTSFCNMGHMCLAAVVKLNITR